MFPDRGGGVYLMTKKGVSSSLIIKGGRSTNKSRKFAADLIFLPQMWHFVDLRFADHIFFAICGFAIFGPSLFADMKLLQIHNFSPYTHKLKMLSYKFKEDDFWFLGQLRGIS